MTQNWKKHLEHDSGVHWSRQGNQLRSGGMDIQKAHGWAERLHGDGEGRMVQHGKHFHVVTSTRAAIDWASKPHDGHAR